MEEINLVKSVPIDADTWSVTAMTNDNFDGKWAIQVVMLCANKGEGS